MALTKAEKQRIQDIEDKMEEILNSMQNDFRAREKKFDKLSNLIEETAQAAELLNTEINKIKPISTSNSSEGKFVIVKNQRKGSNWIETVMNNKEEFVFCSPDYKEAHRFSKEAAINLLQLLNNEILERNRGKAKKENLLEGIIIRELNA